MSLPTPTELLVDPLTGNELVSWTLSLTDTTVTRCPEEAEPRTMTTHTAHFNIVPGTVSDTQAEYSSSLFRPDNMTAKWIDGRLVEVGTSGFQVLKSGQTSDKNRRRNGWSGRYEFGTALRNPVDKAALPSPMGDVLTRYETQVAQAAANGGDL